MYKSSRMKPLTPKMEDILMDCHERQLMKTDPLGTYYSRHSKGLLIRGLIKAEPIIKKGKYLMAFMITPQGVEYLRNNL